MHRDGKHPAQPTQKRRAPLLIQMRHQLSVAMTLQPMTQTGQVPAQLDVVVNLTVKHGPEASTLITRRLTTRRQVQQRQPPKDQPTRVTQPLTSIVRTTMGQSPPHTAREQRRINPVTRPPRDTAHHPTVVR